jgi:hypothetical protein
MVIRNRKLIGLISAIVGFVVIVIWGNILFKIISLPIGGTTAQAKVIGYKANHGYGARMVSTSTSLKHFASGKSPYFVFLSAKGDTVKNYSNAPQIFILFNYAIGDEIKVAYPHNEPQQAVIVNWREFPGLILMLAFGVLLLAVGKDYLIKRSQK